MLGKVEIGIYFCVTADILTPILLKCFWSSPLPTMWILSKSLILIGGHGNRKVKFSRKKKHTHSKIFLQSYEFSLNCWIWLVAMANARLLFLECNIYSILTEYSLRSVHSGERCGPWASFFMRPLIRTREVNSFYYMYHWYRCVAGIVPIFSGFLYINSLWFRNSPPFSPLLC